jgi:tripartite-type tricarboxylate transporter receptor subunit TctC
MRAAPVIFLFATLTAAVPVHAQNFPHKTLRMIVPYAPGGIVDYVGRLTAQRLTENLGHNVIVDNRPGAGGVIGVEILSKAGADGHTLLIMDPAFVINQSLLPKVSYDVSKDILPVTVETFSPLVLAVNAKVPAHNVQELVALARSQPGKLSFASAGIGTTPHMAGELFKDRIRQNLLHVPYKGSGPAMADLVAGQVQMTFSSITAALPFIKDGRLRGLATTGAKRAAALAELPTVAETGFAGFEVNLWLAIFVPSQTAPQIVARLNAELRKGLQHPDMRSALDKVAAEAIGSSPQDARSFVQNEFAKWAAVVKAGNIRPE